ncbi:SusC/RagA family TonB-linked outer membrane protein [Sphingobacterium hungaricum]|uniref:SusC/RagA family TonB-linked outer membrane protein n=1 Tax=Sphingobacterium hungaricum TaxID=2082723 RepID=A0A928UVG1_9SPHI|nr:SusC/RagA family TonB-linked outer membrane protein [Sphingobacterium hungaricum]MBE8712266.1 SusC/RagA family TonB-linked outer membrane protein [Sphingobacterium hungaricum]
MENQIKSIIIFLVLSLYSWDLCAQNTSIKGKVVDSKNVGLSGVSVSTATPYRQLTATDDNGNFTVSVPANATLLFKSVGFDDVRFTVKAGQTNINITLTSSDSDIGEVVVRGYATRSKQLNTGSSTIITRDEVQDVPVGLEQLLQGKVPGMNIQVNTGAPGFRGTTQIRGLSSIAVSGSGDQSFLQPTSPLYVIDGVPLDADRASEFGFEQQGPGVSPLSMIPQEDIESIEILKDAQATALYGSLAAYGVIIITTKRGKSEVPRVRYTHNSFIQTPPKLRETLGGNLERWMKIQQIINNAEFESQIDQISQIPHLADSLNAYFNNSTDWQNLYYRTTYNQSHNLNIDGGNEKLAYKANIGYLNQQGIIRNTGFERYSANLRMDYNPDRKFKFVGQVFAQLGKQNKGDGLGILQSGVANGGESSTLLPPPSFYSSSTSYLSSINTRNDNNVRLIKPFIEASYEVLTGLRVSTTLSYEFVSSTEDTFTPAAANNQFSQVYSFSGRETQLYSRNAINYSKSFNDKHNIFFNFFNEIRDVTRLNTITRQARTPNDQFEGPLGFDGYSSRGGGISGFADEKSLSFAFGGSYDYMKRYVLDLSYRMDGSSRNGFENLYTTNPAIGMRWNAHNETWAEDLSWLSLASLRMSWGVNVMPNSTLDRIYGRYVLNGSYNNLIGIGIDYDLIPNPNLKPTTSSQYNLGLDFSFLNNRIDIVYDTYYKEVTNLLFDAFLNNTTGFNKLQSNDAAITNFGHELAVTVRPLRPTSNLKWTISVNGAYNKDILTQLPSHYSGQFVRFDPDNNGQHNIFRVGTSTLSNYLLINKGVYANDSDVPVDPNTGLRYRMANGEFFQAGDPIWEDRNGDYILDDRDYMRTGNSQPLFTGGAYTNLMYKQWGLTINASYTAVRTILNNALARRLNLMNNPLGQGGDNKVYVPLDDVNVWLKPGDQATYPYPYDYSRSGRVSPFRYDQTLWAEDGSYFKINSLILSYNFDKDVVRRFGLQQFRMYVSTENVITFSKYSGPNPEAVTSMGRDLSSGYPVPRTYNLGFNIEF